MKQIALKALSLSGFKSFTRESVVDLDCEGLVLVSGDNQVEPRLGANGAGKSTLWDALCFCLYGFSVRGTRIGDLVSAGDKALAVTAVLDIDGEEVVVSRSGPPARISVDGRAREQVEVDRLVGMSRTRWLNSVVFGQAVPLFIDLPVPQRGELLDEILDLQFWMQAADVASGEHRNETRMLGEIRVSIGREEGALASLEPDEALERLESEWGSERNRRVADLSTQRDQWKEAHDQRLAAMIDQFEQRELEYNEAEAQTIVAVPDVDALWKSFKDKEAAQKKIELERARLEQSSEALTEAITFFKGAGDRCPVCTQEITDEFAAQHLGELREKAKALIAEHATLDRQWANARATANDAHETWHDVNATAADAKSKNAVRDATLRSVKLALDHMEKQIEQVGGEEDPFSGQIERALSELNPHSARRKEVAKAREASLERLTVHRADEKTTNDRIAALDYWKQGYRRVRLFCIRRVLQQLEVETMNAAGQLGLVGWKIGYATETETKSGSTKTGVQITVESPTMAGAFSNWSGGEGQRVRLCVALGLAGLIQRWAGVRWNLEVFDEPTAWLSEAGIEDLLELLKTRADLSGKSIFLCDHRALSFAGFNKIMTVVKDEHGSRIQ